MAAIAFSTSHCLFKFRKSEESTSAMCCLQTLVLYVQKPSTVHAHILQVLTFGIPPMLRNKRTKNDVCTSLLRFSKQEPPNATA